MQLDLYTSEVLEIDAATVKAATIPVGWKLNCIKAVAALEARIAWCVARLDPAEKCLKRLIQPPQGRLTTGKVGRSQER